MNNKQDEAVAEAVLSKWGNLVRQQSMKIGTLADTIVLPRNERFSQRIKTHGTEREMQNLGTVTPQTHVIIDEHESTKKKVEHFPIFMIGVSVLQIILFYTFDEDLLTMKFGYDPHRRHEIWRFFTAMLVHSGYSHLWGNVLMQLLLGVFLEIVHKWKRIAVIYLASLLGGSLCVTILDNKGYSVGASDGVMGLLFAHLATIILNWNEMERKFARFFCLSLYIVHDISTTVYSEVILKENSNVSHAAHFGGSVAGFLISILVLKNFKKLPWEDTMQKICVGILITLFVIVFVVNVTGTDFPTNEWNFDYEKTFQQDDTEDNTVYSTTTYGDDY